MENTIKLIAEQLLSKNKIIKSKTNSIFEGIDLYHGDEDAVQEISREIAVKLGNEVDLFKNKLLPLMKEINDLVTKKLAAGEVPTDTSKYKVIEYDLPVVVSKLKLTGLVEKFREPKRLQDEVLYIPAPAKLDIFKYLELDNPDSTNALQVIAGKYSDEQLLEFWEKYLSNISNKNNFINIALTNPVANIETILILFAITYNLAKAKPSEVDAKDDKYFGIINYFNGELANYIAMADVAFDNGRKNGKLVIGFDDDGYTIKVDEKIYQSFIDEGYSPEVLFGLACSNMKSDVAFLFYDKIKEASSVLLENWNKKVRIEQYTESINNIQRHRTVYSVLLPDIYNLVPEDLKEILNVTEEEAMNKLIYKLNTEKESEIVDTLYMSREIVGYCLFEQTGFHRFTRYMMEIEKMNPEFNASEIANFATVQLLLEYLTDQLDIESF